MYERQWKGYQYLLTSQPNHNQRGAPISVIDNVPGRDPCILTRIMPAIDGTKRPITAPVFGDAISDPSELTRSMLNGNPRKFTSENSTKY